jgi:hypothetical protein
MKWMFLSVGAGVAGFGIGVAACGSVAESGNDGGAPESESPLSDSAPPDFDSSSDGNSGDDVSKANNNDGAGCHTIAGGGSSKVCTYSASPDSDAGCASGATLGSCPSAGLYGCCLVSPAGDGGDVDGGTTTTATCYYSPDAGAMGGMSAIDSCQFAGYQGLPYQWIVMAP